jgi:hypothetical protein
MTFWPMSSESTLSRQILNTRNYHSVLLYVRANNADVEGYNNRNLREPFCF